MRKRAEGQPSDNGADVASMSFGAYISNDPETDAAIEYAYNAGVTMLAASGNENDDIICYPANHAYVIGVGAASPCGDRKRSSSSPSELNPGVNPDPNGYTCDGERWWGSSYGSITQDAPGAVDVLGPTIVPTTDIGGGGGYQPGESNFAAIQAWNAASVYQRAIAQIGRQIDGGGASTYQQ